MLQGVGLSGLTAFASLYFAARSWGHAGLVMTAFGIGFIFVRVVLGSLPDRMSGYRVALWSLIVEAIGQAMLWGAPQEIVALAGALVTGLGCALVFPALGVEALKRVLPANRGSAMGAFVAFLDIAYGVAGPAAGSSRASSATPPFICSAPSARFLVPCSWSPSAARSPRLDSHRVAHQEDPMKITELIVGTGLILPTSK